MPLLAIGPAIAAAYLAHGLGTRRAAREAGRGSPRRVLAVDLLLVWSAS